MRYLFFGMWVLFVFFSTFLHAEKEKDCRSIQLADVGWSDITATTAITAELLRTLGYNPQIQFISVPVTFKSLQTGDIDVFLGNWMPTQVNDIQPYFADQSVQKVAVNLTGARYTLAVPRYVYEAGVTSAEHLALHKNKFEGKIYGIEPGNDGNRLVLEMISKNTYNLKEWHVIESSEQAMLMEVQRAVKQKKWIVFLGWQPHPMNSKIEMNYLDDPLEIWGPGGGASEVHTIVSTKFAERCPELVQFFENLVFTVEMENEWMKVLESGKKPEDMAKEWLYAHPEQALAWRQGLPAEAERISQSEPVSGKKKKDPFHFLGGFKKIPLGQWMKGAVDYLTGHFSNQFRLISEPLKWMIEKLIAVLSSLSPLFLILFFGVLAYLRNRSFPRAIMIVLSFTLIWNLGYWEATIQTIALIVLASTISVFVGVPIGVWSARHPFFYRGIRLLLDLMQTIPTFVYLIPTLMLFGLGVVPGLISTVIFAIPAPIRLTHLGIHGVPKELIEAGQAFGASPFQILFKIEIPYAMPSIMEGISQAIMLSLSMVVIAALVGAEGLGTDVVRALNTVNIAQGFEAGLSIVIVAVCFDRMLKKKNPFGMAKEH